MSDQAFILISTDHTKLPRYQYATVGKTQCWRSLTACRSHNIISDSLRPATLGILRRSRYDAYVDQVLHENTGRVSDISDENNKQMLLYSAMAVRRNCISRRRTNCVLFEKHKNLA